MNAIAELKLSLRKRTSFNPDLSVILTFKHPDTIFSRSISVMLPPIDTNTSTALPKFDALYCDLCANKLNADGSSKLDAKALKERQVFDEVSSAGHSGFSGCRTSALLDCFYSVRDYRVEEVVFRLPSLLA